MSLFQIRNDERTGVKRMGKKDNRFLLRFKGNSKKRGAVTWACRKDGLRKKVTFGKKGESGRCKGYI